MFPDKDTDQADGWPRKQRVVLESGLAYHLRSLRKDATDSTSAAG